MSTVVSMSATFNPLSRTREKGRVDACVRLGA
jgi:hypothetical protein